MDSQYKVFYAGYYNHIGDIICVITGEKKENTIFTEWYCLVRSEKCTRKKGFSIKSMYFDSIEDFWEKETKTNLKKYIFYKIIRPVLENSKTYFFCNPFLDEINLKVADDSWLYCLKTENEDFIDFINENTSCTELKSFITILKKIEIERFPIGKDED